MMDRTLIFDFDGTIADTLEEARRIFNRIAPDYGIRQIEAEELVHLRHLSLAALLEHLNIPRMRVPGFLARGTSLMRGSIARLSLIRGMPELLPALRPRVRRFGILTSNATANVEAFLESHELAGLFDFISSTSKLSGKATHLRAIRKRYALEARDLLYIGDEIRDVRAAKKAGIPVAAVTWGFNSRESLEAEQPDYVFDHPRELLQLGEVDGSGKVP